MAELCYGLKSVAGLFVERTTVGWFRPNSTQDTVVCTATRPAVSMLMKALDYVTETLDQLTSTVRVSTL
jgi:hypothetical protein